MSLLVVAGEGSGDLLASRVVARLGAPAFGLGGPLLEQAGCELVADLRPMAAMGVGAVPARTPAALKAVGAVARAALKRRPRVALLVGLSEPNALVARALHARGTRVLWYAPPQVWAWRPGRAPSIARSCDALALVLPFEADTWSAAGGRAVYVGHPALETNRAAVTASNAVALLPGSRPHEVRAHLDVLLGAATRLRTESGVAAFVVQAPAVDAPTARFIARKTALAGVPVTTAPLSRALSGASVALVASGTATLECAALGVPPVIVYRTDPVTYALARRLVRVPFIGLPNLVLGRPAFPELVQGALTPDAAARAVQDVLGSLPFHARACAETRATLERGLDARAPSERVASLLEEWLP